MMVEFMAMFIYTFIQLRKKYDHFYVSSCDKSSFAFKRTDYIDFISAPAIKQPIKPKQACVMYKSRGESLNQFFIFFFSIFTHSKDYEEVTMKNMSFTNLPYFNNSFFFFCFAAIARANKLVFIYICIKICGIVNLWSAQQMTKC